MVVGNVLVLGGLAATTWDLLATRRLVAEGTVDACLQAAGLDPYDVDVTDVRLVGPGLVTARWRGYPNDSALDGPGQEQAGGLRCEPVTPVAPVGVLAPDVERAELLP